MTSSGIISEDDFPFTEAELRRALALVYLDADAAREAARLATLGRHVASDESAEGPRLGNVVSGGYTLVVPDFWVALVAELGPAEAARCDAWRLRERRAGRRVRERNATYAAGLDPRSPPPATIVARLDAQEAAADAQWAETRAAVHQAVLDVAAGHPRPRIEYAEEA